MNKLAIVLFAVMTVPGWSQQADLPDDFLSSAFHRERRQQLREKLPANAVAVFFTNPVRNRANDVDYVYHQDPDFYYLTGYKEPHGVLLIFKEMQQASNGASYNEIVFVQPRDAQREMWTGRRLGPDQVKSRLGLQQAFEHQEFKKYNLDFASFDQVLFFDFHDDVRDNPADSADLYDLIKQFKAKVHYPVEQQLTLHTLEGKQHNLNTSLLPQLMNALRGIKTAEELDLIRKAVSISCQGQVQVMKAIHPGMSEREVQGIHEFVFKKYEAEAVGYPSIVGGGHNGCILHYIDNYKPVLTNKELILMDLGAEYHGYTADVTRTIPVKGAFSEEQKKIYELVLKAQEAAMEKCKAGASFANLTVATRQTINEGLAELKIIDHAADPHRYYPHGCCHHIGLDVHDRGTYTALEENMTITIEPGIYITENSPCDKKWWGIAVRIEDDYLVNKNGCELLSIDAPRSVADVEKLMAQPSPLDNFILPDLETEK